MNLSSRCILHPSFKVTTDTRYSQIFVRIRKKIVRIFGYIRVFYTLIFYFKLYEKLSTIGGGGNLNQ